MDGRERRCGRRAGSSRCFPHVADVRVVCAALNRCVSSAYGSWSVVLLHGPRFSEDTWYCCACSSSGQVSPGGGAAARVVLSSPLTCVVPLREDTRAPSSAR